MRVNTISVNSDSSGKSWSYLRNKHGTESEEIVLPTLENDRGLIMGGSTEEKQEKRDGVYNSPPARFETGGKIQSMAIEKEVVESEGVTANNNSVTIKRKPSSLEIALAEGPILHAEDVVPRKNMKLMPLVCGNMGNRRNPLARMPFFKENTLIRQHRNALCLNLISQEMECRLEIWREHAVDLYVLFMEEICTSWRNRKPGLGTNLDSIGMLSNSIETFLDFILAGDLNPPFTGYYNSPILEISPNKLIKGNTRWSWRQMVRPWRKSRENNKSTLTSERGTRSSVSVSTSPSHTALVTESPVTDVDHKKMKEYQRVINASRFYLLTREAHHIRYAIWRDVLFSTCSKLNSSVSLMLSTDTPKICSSSISSHSSSCTQWISFLRILRNAPIAIRPRVAERRTPPRADALFATYDLMHPNAVVTTRRKRLTSNSSLSQIDPHNMINNNNNVNDSSHGVDEDSVYSASLRSDFLFGASSSAPDASLMYTSICSLNAMNSASATNISPKKRSNTPVRRTVRHASITDLLSSRDLSICGAPPSRFIYAMCVSFSMKSLVLIMRMENYARRELCLTESAKFNCILRWRARSTPWMSEVPTKFLNAVSRMTLGYGFRLRNLGAQMVDEKCIAATRYENEIRRMLLYKDFLTVLAEEERNAMEFFDFVQMERRSFLS